MPGRGPSFGTPLQGIPEEGTPLRSSFTQGTGSGGGTRGGAGHTSAPAAGKRVAGGDLESPELSSSGSWLSSRLRWPVVPIYSDVGTSHWYEATLHYVAMTAAPAAWVTGPYALSRLTWAGLPMLAFVIACHYYCAMLMAELHTWNVVIRHTRYRDLGKSIWGFKGFFVVFCFQNFGAMLGNIPVVLSVAIGMKSLHASLHPEGNVPIAWWLLLYGVIQLALSQIPTMHQLRHLNAAAAAMSGVWAVMSAVQCIQSGQALRRTGTDISYAPAVETPVTRVLGVFEAPSIFSFAIANVLLPEIQSVVKPPAVANGRKGFGAAVIFMGVAYSLVCVSGYWFTVLPGITQAFGNAVNPVFTVSLPASRGWIMVTTQVLFVVQSCVSLQLWARPTFEVMEYLLIDYFTTEKINLMSPKNCIARLCGTGVYVLATSYLAGLSPSALGDWANMCGALCFIPLDLVLPLLLWNSVQKPSRWRRTGHFVVSGIWILIATAAVTAAIYRLTTVDVLNFWADVEV